MASLPTVEDLGRRSREEAQRRLEHSSVGHFSGSQRAGLRALAESIRNGTITLDEVDRVLSQTPDLSPKQKEYLLWKKAALLWRDDRQRESLTCLEKALETWPESPSTWAWKATALLQLERLDEAFECFRKAYSHRDNFGAQADKWLELLFGLWSEAAQLRGLLGIYHDQPSEAEKGATEYIAVLERAQAEGLRGWVVAGFAESDEEPWSPQLREAVEEWELMVKLLSIKDPFDRWRAFTKEISKVWPQGVSAIDAIREQRE